jgi:hypothetical protein
VSSISLREDTEYPDTPLDRAMVLKSVRALSSEIILRMDVIEGVVEVWGDSMQIYLRM